MFPVLVHSRAPVKEMDPNQTTHETGPPRPGPSRYRMGVRGNKRGHVDVRGAATDSDSVGGDIFFFSQRPTSTAINHKNKAKLAVLRTISKMLEENKLIRQRLATISQAD